MNTKANGPELALRNKDAKELGMYGPECGDIIYFLAEGFNRIHGDSLTTMEGFWGFFRSANPDYGRERH